MSLSFRLQFAALARRVGLLALPVALFFNVIAPRPALAQGPEAVAAGAAVAGVVLQAIGGLSSWVNEQSNDCYVAALGAAWGKDCNLKKEECKDTGWSYASCNATGDNDCGHGFGQGFASEGLLGSWSSCKIQPFAIAWTRALHTSDDSHAARGWGMAGVDGTSKSKEDATPGAAPDTRPLAALAPLDLYPNGTIVAHITVDTLTLSAGTIGGGSASVNLSVQIDGLVVWTGSARMDQTGVVTLGGALAGTPVVQWFDPTTSHFEARIYGYAFDYVVGTIGGVAAPGAGTTAERDVSVHMDGDAEADAGNASTGGNVTYVNALVSDLHMIDYYGEPLLKGQYVSIPTPLVVTCTPNWFGPAMSDFELYDPQSNMCVGALDFGHYPNLQLGDQVMVRGCVTHHEGRTVLIETELLQLGLTGVVPPPRPMPILPLLQQAEYLEGSLVSIPDVHVVGGDPWPLPGECAVVTVMDGSGATIDMEIDGDTDIDGTPAPYGPFQLVGFLSQYDLDSQGHQASPGGRNVLSPAAGGPGYFDGYRIRPRGMSDLIGAAAGVGDAPRPNANPAFVLRQNRPNPFNPVTGISFHLNQSGPAQILIFAIDGRLVRTLLDAPRSAGDYVMDWDGRDDAGRALPSGLYLYTLVAGGHRETRKMLMAK